MQRQPTHKHFSTTNAYLLLGLMVYSVLCLFPPQAHAEAITLKISPSNLQIHASPPADIRAPFTLVNKSSSPVSLKIIVKAIKQSNKEDGQFVYLTPSLIDERPQDAFLKNVLVLDDGFALSSLSLGPNQEKKLVISINADKNAPPLDHYFSVIFLSIPNTTPSSSTDEKETKSYVQAGINLPVLFSVGTTKDEVGFIDTFSTPFFMQSGPVPFTVKIKNSGTHFISPKGVILIKNLFGQPVGKVELPPTSVLAGTSRYVRSSSNTDASLSPEQTKMLSLKPQALWPERFLFGFYTATLTITMANNDILYTRSVYFAAFPFTGFLIIASFIFISFVMVKRVKEKLSEE